jgi:hypothetical protein
VRNRAYCAENLLSEIGTRIRNVDAQLSQWAFFAECIPEYLRFIWKKSRAQHVPGVLCTVAACSVPVHAISHRQDEQECYLADVSDTIPDFCDLFSTLCQLLQPVLRRQTIIRDDVLEGGDCTVVHNILTGRAYSVRGITELHHRHRPFSSPNKKKKNSLPSAEN